jgi:membrane dipeptidase
MSDRYDEAADRIHQSLPVFDGHNDLPWAIRERDGSSLDAADPNHSLPDYHTDVPRLLAGGVGAQFWSVYVPADSEAPLRDTLEQITLTREMIDRCPDLELALTGDDVDRIRGEHRIASLLGAEGGHSIEGSLDTLRDLFSLGVRYMTLTHNSTLDWADSATDDAVHGGLNEFGRQVVREMNDLGMLVDISHVSPDTMRDAIAVSRAPVIASHSSAFTLAAHPRNMPDEVLEMVRDNGGVVMVNFYSAFVKPEAPESATLFDVVDHIEHIAGVAGVDHVGLGSDFDGVDMLPEGLEDVSRFPAITAELLRRGWTEPDARKVLGENALRTLRSAEHTAT